MMFLSIHATVHEAEGELVTRLGSPIDHRMDGDFLPSHVKRQELGMEITLWYPSLLPEQQAEKLGSQVAKALGFSR